MSRANALDIYCCALGLVSSLADADAFVDELFILKEHRGCGHGGTAMELLIPEAKMLGINKLFLEVSQDNQAALEIYRRVGFQMRKHYQLMELPL